MDMTQLELRNLFHITHEKKTDLTTASSPNQICLSSHSLAAANSHNLAATNTVSITVAYPATNVSYANYHSDNNHSEPYLTSTTQQHSDNSHNEAYLINTPHEQHDTQTSLSYSHYSETG